jgi:uncharacterized protein YebE (UPF0316 family)
MDFLFTPDAWIGALTIFALRLADMSLDTLRVLFVMKSKKGIAWVLGFFQSSIFVIAITSVLSKVTDNPLMLIGYAAGFATGNVLGMWIEEKLAIGHIHITITSPKLGVLLADELRAEGFAVTEIAARGRDGMVSILSMSVLRKTVPTVEAMVHAKDPDSFVFSEEVRTIHRGFWRS